MFLAIPCISWIVKTYLFCEYQEPNVYCLQYSLKIYYFTVV